MTPFYLGAVMYGSDLLGAEAGTIVQLIGFPGVELVKLRDGNWHHFDLQADGPISDVSKYVIVGFADLDTPNPVEELAEELFRATHPYVSREIAFDDLSGSAEYREIARLVLMHFDHKIRGPVDVA